MIEMIEQCTEINTTLNEGMHVVSTNVRSYFVNFRLPGINDLESRRNSG